MADLTRAADLVQTIERDAEFQATIQAAPTVSAKREVLDAHGRQDISLDDMRAYVESKGRLVRSFGLPWYPTGIPSPTPQPDQPCQRPRVASANPTGVRT